MNGNHTDRTTASPGPIPVRAGLAEKVRVFIGTEPKAEIARKVLECSIKRHSNSEVECIPMIGAAWQYSTAGFQQGTGFSLRRWMIPAFCGWKGRAIYLDADQLVFSDIWDLWTKPEQIPNDKASVWCTYQPDKYNVKPAPQSSVMVIDCEKAKDEWGWRIDEVLGYLKLHNSKDKYADFMHMVGTNGPAPGVRNWWTIAPPARIGVEWNSLNVFAPGKTKLLHYTKEPEQPWYKPDHPYAMQWKMEFQIALNLGYVTGDEVKEAVANWGKKEDWRPTNGLHPEYLEFIPRSQKKKK